MLLIGICLAAVALILGFATLAIYGLTGDPQLLDDLRVRIWPSITYHFVSIGYFFVAYRGLSTTERRPPVRRRRRPPEAAPPVVEQAK